MRFGLIGEKLGHSYSKVIHEMLGEYEYELIPLEGSQIDNFLKERDFTGLNVTIPYKKTVMSYCDHVSELAEKLGAVNTLYFNENDELCGTNTDYHGFLKASASAGIVYAGKRVLVLGDGGAGGMVRQAVRDSGAAEVIVATRDPAKSAARGEFTVISYEALAAASSFSSSNGSDPLRIETIVNTTPVGMYPDTGHALVDIKDFPECEGVFDLIYNPALTALLLQARKSGIAYENGLSMLVSQATEAAAYFTGRTGAAGGGNSGRYNDLSDRDHNILSALRMQMMNIVLIGMPGSGKSSVGRSLSEITGKKFVDMDDEIKKKAGMSIPEIFEKYGETYFRDLESEFSCRLGQGSSQIIATGGGVILREHNMDALSQNAYTVLLERPMEELEMDGRPLSKDIKTLEAMARERGPLYEKYSDFSAAVSKNGPQDTAADIYSILTAE